MSEAEVLKKQKEIPQKDKGSAQVGVISAITDAAETRKLKKKSGFPLVGTKKEECVPFSGGGIASMAESAALTNQRKILKRTRAVTC